MLCRDGCSGAPGSCCGVEKAAAVEGQERSCCYWQPCSVVVASSGYKTGCSVVASSGYKTSCSVVASSGYKTGCSVVTSGGYKTGCSVVASSGYKTGCSVAHCKPNMVITSFSACTHTHPRLFQCYDFSQLP